MTRLASLEDAGRLDRLGTIGQLGHVCATGHVVGRRYWSVYWRRPYLAAGVGSVFSESDGVRVIWLDDETRGTHCTDLATSGDVLDPFSDRKDVYCPVDGIAWHDHGRQDLALCEVAAVGLEAVTS